jgi:hypothetical protein
VNSTVRELLGADFVGLAASRAVALLLSSISGIEEVYLAESRPLPHLQKRFDLSPTERTVFDRAIEERSRTGLPFWDAALLQLANEPRALRLLDAALAHVSFRGQEQTLSWLSAVSGGLERACDGFDAASEANLTLLSEVRCSDGSFRQLPMVDFHALSAVPNQRRVVEAVVERLFPDGAVLLESGESYHAYGTRLLSHGDFHLFLGRALLCAPIVDRAYLAHQWIEGRCALRLTAGGGKSRVPKVVALVAGN